jgi:predicted MFS family arabinose efflux permease
MAGFSLASILGVPFGLELSKYLGWRGPFFAITCLGVIIFLLALKFLPQAHNKISTLDFRTRVLNILTSFKSTKSLYAFTYTLLAMISGFMIIPNISTYLQLNLGYPRASLGILYFCGGMFTFFTMRYVGKLADQISATIISIYSTILIIIAFSGFIGHSPVPVVIIFIITMVSLSSRNVLLQTISSKIPTSDERGGFMSIISFFTHMGSSCGAFIASLMLSTSVTGAKLEGMTEVASVSLFLSCLIPFLLYLTERKLKISYVS